MSTHPPKRTKSGRHPAVVKLYTETLPALEAEVERLKSDRPKDPRRDGDSEPPTDTVELPKE